MKPDQIVMHEILTITTLTSSDENFPILFLRRIN